MEYRHAIIFPFISSLVLNHIKKKELNIPQTPKNKPHGTTHSRRADLLIFLQKRKIENFS